MTTDNFRAPTRAGVPPLNEGATREFIETGRTENQRIHTDEQTAPAQRGDAFVAGILAANPDLDQLAGEANVLNGRGTAPTQPPVAPVLNDNELIRVSRQLVNIPGVAPETVARIQQLAEMLG